MGDLNLDSFALDLMQKVWAIGNRHGPDSQRKAEIQIAIAEAVGALMSAPGGEAEPVEYQRRMRPLWDSQVVWTPWEKCTKGTYEDCIKVPVLHDWEHEVRALYTDQPAAAVGKAEPAALGPSLLEQSDLDFIAARLGRVARRVGYPMPDGDAQFIVSVSGSILGGIDHAIQLLQQQAPAVDDAVLRDAERYRWLCNEVGNGAKDGVSGALVEIFGESYDSDELDDAIDAAMAKEQGK